MTAIGQKTDTEGVSTVRGGKTRIRIASEKDLPEICALLRRELPGNFSDEQWMQLFNHGWTTPPYHGHVMEADESRIVGFIGAILVERVLDGKLRTVCNLTSWCVDKDYRKDGGLMLLMPYLRKKDWIITTITPAPIVVELFEKMGFKYYDREKIIFPLLWNIRLSDFTSFHASSGAALPALLTDIERGMLNDHAPHGCNGYLCEIDGARVFLITKRRHKRGIPLSEILYCGNPISFSHYLERIKLMLMVRERIAGIICDGRMIQGLRPSGIRLKRPAMARSEQEDLRMLDNLYTERVLLPV